MDSLRFMVTKIFKGAAKSFYRFPASIASAIIISITAIVKISMEWEVEETYNVLFDSIQLSFLFGAVFSMATVSLNEIRSEERKSSLAMANMAGILVAISSFLLLYFFGGSLSEEGTSYLSSIAMGRASVAIFVSAVAFVYIISKAKTIDSFSDSFFITHKAFVISAIYGLVLMLGVSGVLGAFQALIYREMSYKVYQYLGVAVGFLTYTIFLGYFPSFRETEKTDEMRRLEEQPRFIFVLFGYILVPIMLALTIVLLIWSAKVVLGGMGDVSFNQLSSIASSYVIVGIWLHIMVAKHQTRVAAFYKKVYPISAILVLIFEAWALFVQLSKFGLKTAEYSFIMIWIFALISVLILIFSKHEKYRMIAITAMIISIIWVSPIIGYQDITFNCQVNRLEGILKDEGILVDNNIVQAEGQIETITMGEITDAVDFIAYSEKTNTPDWFVKDLNDEKIFTNTFGFKKTYGIYPEETDYIGYNLILETGVVDISDYSQSLTINTNEKEKVSTQFEGKNGSYEISWSNEFRKTPKITVKFEDGIIIEEDMENYLSDLLRKYPPNTNRMDEVPFEDMSMVLEGGDLSILLVFSNINVYIDKTQDTRDYYTDLEAIYIKYK